MTPARPPTTVLVADDHPLFRYGLAAIVSLEPDLRLVGEAADGQGAIALHRELKPDVTLLDLQMPGISGLDALRAIRARTPAARVLILTTYPGDERAARAIAAGAAGFMLKSALRGSLIDAIRTLHAGRPWPREMASSSISTLTTREVDVLGHVAEGRSNREVGELLSISEDAVKARLKGIVAKLAAKDRTHAVTIARRRGLLVR